MRNCDTAKSGITAESESASRSRFFVSCNSIVTVDKIAKAVYLPDLRKPFFGMIPVVTHFVVREEACGNEASGIYNWLLEFS